MRGSGNRFKARNLRRKIAVYPFRERRFITFIRLETIRAPFLLMPGVRKVPEFTTGVDWFLPQALEL